MAANGNSTPACPEGRLPLVRRVLVGLAALLLMSVSAVGAWLLRERWQHSAPRGQAGSALSPPGSPSDEKRARLLYVANCQACHGPEGHGDGSAAVTLKPPPRDFGAAPWKFGATPDAVRRVLRDGSPGTAMPSFALLSEGDRDALAAFVLSLAPPDAREPPALSPDVAARFRRLGFTTVERPMFAPNLALRDLEGRELSLDRWRGKVVLLNFWGTSCVHCIEELPALEKLSHDVGDGFVVVSVCFDETDAGEVRRLIQGRVREMPVYINPDGLARARYDVQTMPSLYLLDPAGRLVGRSAGARSWPAAEWRELIRALHE